jgi:hypothetical protein
VSGATLSYLTIINFYSLISEIEGIYSTIQHGNVLIFNIFRDTYGNMTDVRAANSVHTDNRRNGHYNACNLGIFSLQGCSVALFVHYPN